MTSAKNTYYDGVVRRGIVLVVVVITVVGSTSIAVVGTGAAPVDESVSHTGHSAGTSPTGDDLNDSTTASSTGEPSIEIIELETVKGDPLTKGGLPNVYRVAPQQDFQVVVEYENLTGASPYEIQIVDDDGWLGHNELVTRFVFESSGRVVINVSSSEFPLEYGNDPGGFETEARWVADDGTVQAHSAEYSVAKAASTIYLDSDSVPDTVADGESVTVRAYGWSEKSLDVQLWNADTEEVIDHAFWNAEDPAQGFEKEYTFVAGAELSQSPPGELRLQGRTNQNGPDSATHSITVTEDNQPPTASFTYSPTDPTAGESVTFDASSSNDSDGSIETYRWDFDGDGTFDTTGELVEYTFEQTGSHDVSLAVTDDSGAQDVVSRTVTVIDGETIVSVDPAARNVSVGGTVQYDVVVSRFDNGISSYEFDATLGSATTAKIVDVRLQGTDPDDALTSIEYATDNGSVSVAAGNAGHDEGVIATITVEGVATGTTDLSLRNVVVGDNTSDSYTIDAIRNGTVSVGDAPAVVGDSPAQDIDGDGRYEDVNGDGEFDIVDVNAFFQHYESAAVQNNVGLFDFNGDGTVDIVDVNRLFQLSLQ
jgi:PKD repeat protein